MTNIKSGSIVLYSSLLSPSVFWSVLGPVKSPDDATGNNIKGLGDCYKFLTTNLV